MVKDLFYIYYIAYIASMPFKTYIDGLNSLNGSIIGLIERHK